MSKSISGVIGFVHIYMCTKIIVIVRTRDLIYLKFVATDFSPKLISQDFCECTEAVATSLIPLVTNFPEICAFIIGFSFTAWTKKRSFRAI